MILNKLYPVEYQNLELTIYSSIINVVVMERGYREGNVKVKRGENQRELQLAATELPYIVIS